jgi:hypothetical protein
VSSRVPACLSLSGKSATVASLRSLGVISPRYSSTSSSGAMRPKEPFRNERTAGN